MKKKSQTKKRNKMQRQFAEHGKREFFQNGVFWRKVTIAVKHVNKGTITRFFLNNSKMNNVYDWVRSRSIHPVHFKLRQYHSIVAISDPAAKYDNPVLNMKESDTGFSFDDDDDDEEVTMLGYSSKESFLERLEKKRNDAKMAVYLPSLSQDKVIYKVDRFNVIEELFSVFGKRVGIKFLNLEYKDENTFGDGVTKDV